MCQWEKENYSKRGGRERGEKGGEIGREKLVAEKL